MSTVDHGDEAGRAPTGLLARAGGLFLQPEAPSVPLTAAAPPRPASTAAVLAATSDLAAAAGGVAARLRAGAKARTAVVCRPGAPSIPRPATPSATRLARRLAARDLEAVAAGTLVRVALPPDPADAVRAAWRLIAAVEVPVVLALPGRLDGFDVLLAQLDELHLAAPAAADDALAELALASLAALGPPVHRLHPPATALARHRASLGFAAVAAPEAVPA
jgi:hypothetical protein